MAYIPTVAVTSQFHHIDVDPVDVFSVDATDDIVAAIARRFELGNTSIPHPAYRKWPPWVVQKAAGVRSTKEFDRGRVGGSLTLREVWTVSWAGPDGEAIDGDIEFPVDTDICTVAKYIAQNVLARFGSK